MGFDCGIIGLPNVGKTTIFNALSGASAPMASYPFTTIEPNRHFVSVPDERLQRLSELLSKENPIPTRIEFVDVAGLVKGASKGEGLGNQFLGHIRTVDAIIQVVRCFDSPDAVNVMGELDPLRDIEVINTELILADLELLDRAREKSQKQARGGDKEAQARVELLERAVEHLNQGRMLRDLEWPESLEEMVRSYGLITAKPVLYVANVGEEDRYRLVAQKVTEKAAGEGAGFMIISGKLEEEISELPQEEKQEYLEAMGLKASGLNRLIQAAYRLLGLITFYTVTTDLQAWTIKGGASAVEAAGKIHTDFARGFVRAEIVHYDDLVATGSEANARHQGHLRTEGREYPVRDGDVIHFLFHT